MPNIWFCKQIFIDQYHNNIYYTGPDETWLEGISKGDYVFYHLLGSQTGRDYVNEHMPSEIQEFQELSCSVTKLMKFVSWEKNDDNNYFAKFEKIYEFDIPIRKFQALDIFKFNISLLNKTVKQTKNRSLFKLELDKPEIFFNLIENNKFVDYVYNNNNYRKFIKCSKPDQFNPNTNDIQFYVTNPQSKDVIINTKPSFFDVIREKIITKNLKIPLDKANTYRNKFINYIFKNTVNNDRYYDLFTGFWDALCQNSFSSQKNKKDVDALSQDDISSNIDENSGYLCEYSNKLLNSMNIILRGAPGTGKTYLAKKIATDIITNGNNADYESLNNEQKEQIEFVQFHPNYDYTDFVEGIKPNLDSSTGNMIFELQDGIFKKFVNKARKNYENANKSDDEFIKYQTAENALDSFLNYSESEEIEYKNIRGNIFFIVRHDDTNVYINVPQNKIDILALDKQSILSMLESNCSFNTVKDITSFFEKNNQNQAFSYFHTIYHAIKNDKRAKLNQIITKPEVKPYIFIIDEINRGEISKILGELFFAIEPNYRGINGAISTQYQNLHKTPTDKFYIPKNVYIIGTMNDIDRSVDTFDFAMRRRFRFIEIKPEDRIDMLDELHDDNLKKLSINCMNKLNEIICSIDGLNPNYQIGPAYFLKLKELSVSELWSDCLKPLLHEYVQGMLNEHELMSDLERVFVDTFNLSLNTDLDNTINDYSNN